MSSPRIEEEVTRSEEETAALAARYAASLEPGDLILVSGEIGAGKSTFVRAALRELGVEGPIPSPTFTIGRSYRGRVPLHHLDLYRLEDAPEEEVPDLLGEYLDPAGITFVEWPRATWRQLLRTQGRVRPIEISLERDDARRIRFGDPVKPRS